jgi:hypothetical protein
MPIKTVQARLSQVGVIRLGEQRPGSNGKMRPVKLETLRFTSASKKLIDAIAGLYGGQAKPWQAPVGPQFEVITDAKEVPVLVPPQRIDPNMEHWGNGYRDRLCDAETEKMRQCPCLCLQMQSGGRRVDPKDLCKPTTRASLMLADVPSLGTWKLESHGWNFAAESPSVAAYVQHATRPVPALLLVEKREKKDFDPSAPEGKQISPKVYMVPVLRFDWLTPAQAFGGELEAAARMALGARAAERHAIEAAKVESTRRKFTPAEYLTLAEAAEDIDHVRELWTDAKADGALTDEVKAALNAKAAKVTPVQPEPAVVSPAPAAEPTPATDVVDAEVAPNADEVWAQIQPLAGAKKWSADDLERRVIEHLKKPSNEADGFELTRFLDAVKGGEVA